MFDLLALAYQADITRVSTLMYARDLSPATYPASGIRDGFHGVAPRQRCASGWTRSR